MNNKIKNMMKMSASLIVIAATVGYFGYNFPLYAIIVFLTAALGVSIYYLISFAKIIMVIEDDLGSAVDSLLEVEESMELIVSMKLYFDTPEVGNLVRNVMDSVKIARFSVNNMISTLTERSKQKWVLTIDEEDENGELAELNNARMELSHKEGTLLSVERSTTSN